MTKVIQGEVDYFPLKELLARIEISDNVKEHLEETKAAFDEYFSELMNYDQESRIKFMLYSSKHEIKNSGRIENHRIDIKRILDDNIYFDNFDMSEKRIKNIHAFAMENKGEYEFRSEPVWIEGEENGEKVIYWYGVKAEDINKFMRDFIDFYINQDDSLLNDKFIKSALIHLIFVRIHPFNDGNGRTSRLLHDLKFTEILNKELGLDLRLSPIHLSKSIDLSKVTYCKILDSFRFNPDFSNDILNKWLEFILNMYDEQIYLNRTLLENYKRNLKLNKEIDPEQEFDDEMEERSKNRSRY